MVVVVVIIIIIIIYTHTYINTKKMAVDFLTYRASHAA